MTGDRPTGPRGAQAHYRYWDLLNKELSESGEPVGVQGLAAPRDPKVVRAGRGGGPVVTDGPFPEAQEFLAGTWIVDVDRPERPYEIAAKASAARDPVVPRWTCRSRCAKS